MFLNGDGWICSGEPGSRRERGSAEPSCPGHVRQAEIEPSLGDLDATRPFIRRYCHSTRGQIGLVGAAACPSVNTVTTADDNAQYYYTRI